MLYRDALFKRTVSLLCSASAIIYIIIRASPIPSPIIIPHTGSGFVATAAPLDEVEPEVVGLEVDWVFKLVLVTAVAVAATSLFDLLAVHVSCPFKSTARPSLLTLR